MKKAILAILIFIFVIFGVSAIYIINAGERALEQALDIHAEDTRQASDNLPETEEKNTSAVAQPTPEVPQPAEVTDTDAQENKKVNQSLAENLDKVKEKMPVTEKASISAKVIKKLTPSDIAELQGMLSNGVTAEEKKRAKEILYSRLTSEDIEMIKDAYSKYSAGE